MILVCRDCHATVPFGCDCLCGGTVELSRTQMDDLLQRAWKYQTLETYYEKCGADCDPNEVLNEILRVSTESGWKPPVENAASEPAFSSRALLAGSQRR